MKTIKSDLGWSTRERIVVRGKDLPGEILGTLNLGDMAFLELTGRVPNPRESRLFNAMAVTLVEHGVTPSALAARMTYLGAPEAMQAAVAAGLCGLGSVFVGSMEGAAKMLSTGKTAQEIVAETKRIPGLGHHLHKPVDPRAARLFNATGAIGALACELGLDWRAVRGIGVMARAVGLVGHLLEESREPMAEAIWHQAEAQATQHIDKT
jgi:citrate synthase